MERRARTESGNVESTVCNSILDRDRFGEQPLVWMNRTMGRDSAGTRVIAVTSGKGGVGKTHTTVNLGLALTEIGKRVLLLDADLGLANINIILGFRPKATLHDVLQGNAELKDIVVHHNSGMDIIPAASGITEITNLSEEERASLIDAIDVFAGEYDYMLIDTAAGIGDNVTYFNVAAEDVLVVVDPEPTSITDAYALIKVLSSRYAIKDFLIVANRVSDEKDAKRTFAQLSTVNDKFLDARLVYLGCVESDPKISESIRKQMPYLQVAPSAKASRDIVKIAKRISEHPRQRKARGGMQFFFKELLANS